MLKVSDTDGEKIFRWFSNLIWILTRLIFAAACLGAFLICRHWFQSSGFSLFFSTVLISLIFCGLVEYLLEKLVSVAHGIYSLNVELIPTQGRTPNQSRRIVEFGELGYLLNKLESEPHRWSDHDAERWLRCQKLISKVLYKGKNRQRISVIVEAAQREFARDNAFYVERIPNVLIERSLEESILEEVILDRFFLAFLEICAVSLVLVVTLV
jgi:hypothetical protein